MTRISYRHTVRYGEVMDRESMRPRSVRMPDQLWGELEIEAERLGVPVSDILRDAVRIRLRTLRRRRKVA